MYNKVQAGYLPIWPLQVQTNGFDARDLISIVGNFFCDYLNAEIVKEISMGLYNSLPLFLPTDTEGRIENKTSTHLRLTTNTH